MNMLLKSVTILDSTSSYHKKEKDILIRKGIIVKIADEITPTSDTRIVERANLHVSQGWFDSGVSFGEPGFEERETIENGLRTAAIAGFTHVVLNTNTFPVIESKSDISFLKDKASGNAVTLLPLGALTKSSEGKELAELFDAANAGAVGFYDYKSAVANVNLLKLALQYAQGFNGLVFSYPQDNTIASTGIVNEERTATYLGLKGIPYIAENLQVARDLFLLEYTGGKLHIPTISTSGSVKLIREAKNKGLNVSCSTTVHNLYYCDNILEGFDSNTKVLPPLRAEKDRKALLEGVLDGTIDMVTSDHNPLNIELKKLEFDHAAFGTIGLESAFGALNKLFTTEETIEILTRGCEHFGIKKQPIQENITANLTLFDPDEHYRFSEENLQSTSKNSIFRNEELKGKPLGIISNNKFVFVD
jgi:dihydroorotase